MRRYFRRTLAVLILTATMAAGPPAIAALSSTPAWTQEGNQDNAWFGWSLAGLGDWDGDGKAEVAVGVPGSSTSGSGGEVRVYKGLPLPRLLLGPGLLRLAG